MPPSQPAQPPMIPFQNQQYSYSQPVPPLPQTNQSQQVSTHKKNNYKNNFIIFIFR